jgi:hypothetical protein
MVVAEVLLEVAVAWAQIDCIEEQTEVEPILPADIELVVMEADTDNSNCPLVILKIWLNITHQMFRNNLRYHRLIWLYMMNQVLWDNLTRSMLPRLTARCCKSSRCIHQTLLLNRLNDLLP